MLYVKKKKVFNRQGCPVSAILFLFLNVMEILSTKINNSDSVKRF